LEVINYTAAATGDKTDIPTFAQAQLYNLNTKGLRFTIMISRTSKYAASLCMSDLILEQSLY
jgi:hypothetical protein